MGRGSTSLEVKHNMILFTASFLVFSLAHQAASQAACPAGTQCINGNGDVTCTPCDAGTTCRVWITASGNLGNYYCQFDACLTEGAVCSGRVGICCNGLTCGTLTGATDRTCNAPATTTTTTTTTTTAASSQCTTVSGAVPNAPCVFPFIYNYKKYYTCTTAGGFSTPWCSTQTRFGKHVTGQWGDCNTSTCPLESTSGGGSTGGSYGSGGGSYGGGGFFGGWGK